MHRCIRTFLAPASLSAVLLLGACGGDDASDPATTAVPAATASPTPSTSAPTTDAPPGDAVEVVTSDFAFGGLPAQVASGARFDVSNTSADELHELVFIRLEDGETRSVDEIVHGDDLAATLGAGPPAMVVLAPPGGAEAIVAVGDGTLTEPGRYLAICTIPTGVDPQVYLEAAAQSNGAPPSVPGGPPHFTHGMYAEVTVV